MWDFKKHYEGIRTGILSQHSFSHAFCIRREDEITRFRHKLYPQSEKYIPESGLKLIKENSRFPPIAVANFCIERLNLDVVGKDYQKYVESLTNDVIKFNCLRSWENVRDRLEKLPRRQKYLIKMNLDLLPKQNSSDVYNFVEDKEETPIIGVEMHPEKLGKLKEGDDIVVYNDDLVARPLIGKVINVREDMTAEINWFKKKCKTIYIPNRNVDGSLDTSIISRNSIMYIGISSVISQSEIRLTPTMIKRISMEYEKLDSQT